MQNKLMYFLESIFYSYAQIFFSNKMWFGAVILGVTFFIPYLGLMGLFGVFVSNSVALFMKFDKAKIKKGFYGFNGLLFGAAGYYFFELTPFLLMLIIIFVFLSFILSAALEHSLANLFNLPGLSLPFILTLYVFIIFVSIYDDIPFRQFIHTDSESLIVIPDFIKNYFNSLGLIVFQSNVIAGIILSLAILIFSRVMWINTIVAHIVNYYTLQLIMPVHSESFAILTSFNAILTSFALGGSLVLVSKKTIFLLTISTVFVVVFTGFFSKLFIDLFLPVLVLPFNLVVLTTIYSLKFREEQSDFVLLYFAPGSPEENYYYHQNRKSRFEKYKFMLAELPFWGEWKVSQGIEGNITHKDEWKNAWDFVIVDEKGSEYEGNGVENEEFLCFATPVIAPLDGTVVNVVDNVIDNKVGEFNLDKNWGNSVVLNHGEGLFSQLSHLKRGTIKVADGDIVKKGEIIAHAGNSGRSPTSHLHFQFQTNDKIGDKTFKFPISHFIENKDGKLSLKTFEFPEENSLVRNIESHKSIKKAFNFKFGEKLKFKVIINGKEFMETWEVKVDIYNNTYLESDRKAVAYFYNYDKLFVITDFIGTKNSALYYFYLSAIRVPLGFCEELHWTDKIPVSKTISKSVRFFAEFFLMFSEQLESFTTYYFTKSGKGDKFELVFNLENRGRKLFSFFLEKGNGKLSINKDGEIENIKFNKTNVEVSATFLKRS